MLAAWTEGDQHALEELMPLVYNELRRIARHHWGRQDQGETLQPTALIHEAFLKLVRHGDKPFQNRTHFFALASTAMRQVLVNHANASLADQRGGGQVKVSVEEVGPAVQMEAKEVLALNAALTAIQTVDPRKSRVVEFRYFGGLSVEETAQALSVSTVTVKRDWQTARAWLARELGKHSAIQP